MAIQSKGAEFPISFRQNLDVGNRKQGIMKEDDINENKDYQKLLIDGPTNLKERKLKKSSLGTSYFIISLVQESIQWWWHTV